MKRLLRLLMLSVVLALSVGAPLAARAADEAAAAEEHGLSLKASRIHIGPAVVTNSMIVTWIVAIIVIVFARIATRQIKEVPDGIQNFWEWMVEGLYDLLESIVGSDLVKKTFWLFASIFVLILFSNWFGLLPGIGSIGLGHPSGPFLSLAHVDTPIFRGANADLNMTLAMAIVFFLMWILWALQSNGPGGFILHLFGPKGETSGFLKPIMIVVFIGVGVLEVISILFRPVSLSIRLYSNIFAGENMMEAMSNLVHNPPWLAMLCRVIIPIPFYFMEMLVGFVQALVFMLLTAVFTLLICQHDDKGHGPHPH